MPISPDNCRAAFQDFVKKWNRSLQVHEADVDANDVSVDIDGQNLPARNLFLWLRNDQAALPAECCKFFGYPEGTTYGQAARALKSELVDRRRRVYLVKLENPTSPQEPYVLASTTEVWAIEETKALFEPEVPDFPIFHKGEIAVIWRDNRKVAEIRHDGAENPVVTPLQ